MYLWKNFILIFVIIANIAWPFFGFSLLARPFPLNFVFFASDRKSNFVLTTKPNSQTFFKKLSICVFMPTYLYFTYKRLKTGSTFLIRVAIASPPEYVPTRVTERAVDRDGPLSFNRAIVDSLSNPAAFVMGMPMPYCYTYVQTALWNLIKYRVGKRTLWWVGR